MICPNVNNLGTKVHIIFKKCKLNDNIIVEYLCTLDFLNQENTGMVSNNIKKRQRLEEVEHETLVRQIYLFEQIQARLLMTLPGPCFVTSTLASSTLPFDGGEQSEGRGGKKSMGLLGKCHLWGKY